MAIITAKILSLRQMDIFKNVSDGALADLISAATERTFKTGDSLADKHGHTPWCIIIEGGVQVKSNNKISCTVEKQESVGLDFVFCETKPDMEVVAYKKTIALCIDKNTLYRMFVLHPSLFFSCMEMLSKKEA